MYLIYIILFNHLKSNIIYHDLLFSLTLYMDSLIIEICINWKVYIYTYIYVCVCVCVSLYNIILYYIILSKIQHIIRIVCNGLLTVYRYKLKGSYDAISSFVFSVDCYKLFVHIYDPWSNKD